MQLCLVNHTRINQNESQLHPINMRSGKTKNIVEKQLIFITLRRISLSANNPELNTY